LKDKIIFKNSIWVSKSADFDSGFELQKAQRAKKHFDFQGTGSNRIHFYMSLKDQIIFRNSIWVSKLKALDSSIESIGSLKKLQKVQLAYIQFSGQLFFAPLESLYNHSGCQFCEKY
jgi:hypothetical protein